MAHQSNPLTPLVTEEIKEINREDYKESFELSQEEVSRLRSENRELVLKLEKITKKVDKKKGELETEKTNLLTCRELVQALNDKIRQLENPTSPCQRDPPYTPHNKELLTGESSCSIIDQLKNQDTSNINRLLHAKDKQILDLELQIISLQKGQESKDRKLKELREEILQLRSDNVDLENVRSLLETQLNSESDKASTLDRNQGILRKKMSSFSNLRNPTEDRTSIFSNFRRSRSNQATNTSPELTPPIVHIANTTGKSSTRISIQPGLTVHTVKLKTLPCPSEHIPNQVICRVNKKYQLGLLMALFEAPDIAIKKIVTVTYVGIQLYNPVGDCNGEFRGKRFFECEPNCGIFMACEDVLVPVL